MKDLFGIIYLVISFFICAISIVAFRNRRSSNMFWYAMLILAMGINNFGYALELLGRDLDIIYFWRRFQYLGISFYPTLILLFIREVLNHRHRVGRWIVYFTGVMNLVTFVLVITNNWHELYFTDIKLVYSSTGDALLGLDFGPWFSIDSMLLNLALLYTFTSLVLKAINAKGAPRKMTLLLLTGMGFPTITYIIDIFILPDNCVKIGMLSYLFMGLLFLRGITQYRFLIVSGITYKFIVDNIKDIILIFTDDGFLLNTNNEARNVLGGMSLEVGDTISSDPQLNRFFSLSEGEILFESGEHYKTRIIHLEKMKTKIVMLSNVSDLVEARDFMSHQANYDPLTDLPNRRLFHQEYRRLKKETYFALMDIDHFKRTNDTKGHDYGDHVLIELAKLIKRYFRGMVFCRFGGEEFVVIIDREELNPAVEILNEFRREFMEMGHTISIGLSRLQLDSFERTFSDADKQLYQAKSRGRNRIYFKDKDITG